MTPGRDRPFTTPSTDRRVWTIAGIGLAVLAGIATVATVLRGAGPELLLWTGLTVGLSGVTLRIHRPHLGHVLLIGAGAIGIAAYALGVEEPGAVVGTGALVSLGCSSLLVLLVDRFRTPRHQRG